MISIKTLLQEIKNTLAISIPIISSQLLYAIAGFVAVAITARLGEDTMAASVLIATIWSLLAGLTLGVLNSLSILISHQYGAKNYAGIHGIMSQSYFLGFLVTLITVLLLLSVHLFLNWSHQSLKVLTIANQYLHALILTVLPTVFLAIFEQFLLGIGKTKIVLLMGILVVSTEIPLMYGLVLGKLGLPQLGISGVGYGIALANSLAVIIIISYIYFKPEYQRYNIFSCMWCLKRAYLKELFRVGLPISFMQAIEVTAFVVAAFLIAQFSTTMLAAHQLVTQYQSLIITFVFAMSQAVTIRVGHAVGREDLFSIKKAAYTGIFLNFSLMLIISFIFYLHPKLLLQLDLNVNAPANTNLISLASSLLIIASILSVFDNFRIIHYGALRGLKDTRFPMYTAIISFWGVGISMAYLLGFVFHMQARGVWWGLTAGIAVGALILSARLQFLLKNIDLKKLKTIPQIDSI